MTLQFIDINDVVMTTLHRRLEDSKFELQRAVRNTWMALF